MRQPAVYIVASGRNGTRYIGVTSDLPRRAYEYREGLRPRFARRYGCKAPVWFERYALMTNATAREKQVKGAPRRRR